MRFLVTAGNTREAIDQVRDWGNIFTGNTGFAIAKALTGAGDVHLLTSNRQHLAEASNLPDPAHPIHTTAFVTHAQLRDALQASLRDRQFDAVFMTAAVSDYQPAGVYRIARREPDPDDPQVERWIVRDASAPKVKSIHDSIAVVGRPTEKIVDLFRSKWNYRGILVKFKLEVGINVQQLLNVAEASRLSSAADYIVANTLDMVGDTGGAYLLWNGGQEFIPRAALPNKMFAIATGNHLPEKR